MNVKLLLAIRDSNLLGSCSDLDILGSTYKNTTFYRSSEDFAIDAIINENLGNAVHKIDFTIF